MAMVRLRGIRPWAPRGKRENDDCLKNTHQRTDRSEMKARSARDKLDESCTGGRREMRLSALGFPLSALGFPLSALGFPLSALGSCGLAESREPLFSDPCRR